MFSACSPFVSSTSWHIFAEICINGGSKCKYWRVTSYQSQTQICRKPSHLYVFVLALDVNTYICHRWSLQLRLRCLCLQSTRTRKPISIRGISFLREHSRCYHTCSGKDSTFPTQPSPFIPEIPEGAWMVSTGVHKTKRKWPHLASILEQYQMIL